MGTRSTTKIYETFTNEEGKKDTKLLLALYKQYDGFYRSRYGFECVSELDLEMNK